MTNRIIPLVLNIRSMAKKAMKPGFVATAGNTGYVEPTAVPQVGQPSTLPPFESRLSAISSRSLRRLLEVQMFLGNRVAHDDWHGADQSTTLNRRFATSRHTAHERIEHHDYPSNDVCHVADCRRIVNFATNRK